MSAKEMARRYSMFFCGVLLSATGIAFITRAGLGTSPISSTPFVLSLITPPTMGVYTFSFNLFFLLCEALIRRRFTLLQALQIPVTLLFSLCIDVALWVIPSQYGGPYLPSVGFLLLGCAVMSLGIALEVMADVIMLPGEALVRALSQRLGKNFGKVKVGFDTTLTVLAAVIALLAFGKLNGVGEGTLFSALVGGHLIQFYTRHLGGLKALWLGKSPSSTTPKTQNGSC